MKSINLVLFTILTLVCSSVFYSSCNDPEAPYTCDDEALFLREGAKGMMLYLPCFDSWSVKLDETNEDSQIIAASYDISESLKVDSTRVIIDACFYEFNMELLFPDPAPWGDMYVIKDFEISADL